MQYHFYYDTDVLMNVYLIIMNSFQVSWIRHRDLHLLTVGKATYTADMRFQSVHNPQLGDWSLKVCR